MGHQHVFRDRLIQRCETSDRARGPVVHPASHKSTPLASDAGDVVASLRSFVRAEVGISFVRMIGEIGEQRCTIHIDESTQVD